MIKKKEGGSEKQRRLADVHKHKFKETEEKRHTNSYSFAHAHLPLRTSRLL